MHRIALILGLVAAVLLVSCDQNHRVYLPLENINGKPVLRIMVPTDATGLAPANTKLSGGSVSGLHLAPFVLPGPALEKDGIKGGSP